MERGPHRRTPVTPGLPRAAWVLGIAGLAPQAVALLATFSAGDHYIGLAAGYFYAALIFSFLGGLWWGVAVAHPGTPDWVYGAAVVPSLLAFVSGVPWMTGDPWPGPSLVLLGVALIASVLVDRALARLGLMPPSMLRLRLILSLGLGALTLALAARA